MQAASKRKRNVAKYLAEAEQAARIGRIACGVQLCRALIQMPINQIQTPESPVYAGINEFFIINPGLRRWIGTRIVLMHPTQHPDYRTGPDPTGRQPPNPNPNKQKCICI